MEWVVPALVVLCVFSLAMSAYAMRYAMDAKIEIGAMKNSTHNIQYVPADAFTPEGLRQETALNKKMADLEKKDFQNLEDLEDESFSVQ